MKKIECLITSKICEWCHTEFKRTTEGVAHWNGKRFCGYSCSNKNNMKGRYKRGYSIDKDGYAIVDIRIKGRKGAKHVRLHRLIMEQHIGRKLKPTEVVHHKDENKLNNDISNLELFESMSAHIKTKHSWTGDEWYKRYGNRKPMKPRKQTAII